VRGPRRRYPVCMPRSTPDWAAPLAVTAMQDDGDALAPPLPPRPAAQVRAAVDKRVGLIEIDLADGTRLRVDAFVNERALQRVLTVLKARS